MIDQFSRKASLPFILLLLLLATGRAWAQPGRPMPGAPGASVVGAAGDKVDLIHADSLNVLNQSGAVVYRLINNVKLQQKGVVLYCDLAIQNKTTNVIEAYGNVRMVQGDTINVRGDTLYYYGNTRQANVLGHVVLKDRKMTLNTARLDYDLLSGVAHYPVKGRIVDRENILTSDEGYYDTHSKQFIFQRNVRLLNQPPGKEKTTILADSLLYNSLSKIADFQGPTRIISKDGVLVARNGQYNTTTRVSNFRQRATAETDKYTLTGDTLNFDNVNEVGVAHGNVVIINKADKTTLTGDHGRYNGKAGVSRMIGHAVVRSPISQGTDLDTLFMRADTLFSFDNKVTKKKKIIGQRNVLVFKSDLQSKCDSLVYDVNDSLLYFYKKPIVWSQNYQMEADSMTAKLKNNRINTMFLKTRAFVISQDTLHNFNQVKGRQITAFFRTILAPIKKAGRPTGAMTASSVNRPTLTPVVAMTTAAEKTTLDRVLVEGNGQTIYFAVDEKNRMVGMNRTECSKMNIEFTASRVTRIRNYGRPDMFLTPPKELTDEKKRLDGFRWREKEKPTRAQTLGLTPLTEPKAAKPQDVVAMLRDKIGSGVVSDIKSVAASPASLSALTGAVTPIASKLMTNNLITDKLTKSVMGVAPIKSTPVIEKLLSVKSTEVAINKPIPTRSVASAVNKLIPVQSTESVVGRPILPKLTQSVADKALPVKVPQPVSDKPISVNPIEPAITKLIPVDPIAEKLTRASLLDKLVAPLASRPFTALPVGKPILVTKPVILKSITINTSVPDQPTAPAEPVAEKSGSNKSVESIAAEPISKPEPAKANQPVADVSTTKPAGTKLTESIITEPSKKPVPVKPTESAKPVAASSSSNTLPTRRAEKQQKAANQLTPKLKPIVPATDQSDLELELNKKPKRQ